MKENDVEMKHRYVLTLDLLLHCLLKKWIVNLWDKTEPNHITLILDWNFMVIDLFYQLPLTLIAAKAGRQKHANATRVLTTFLHSNMNISAYLSAMIIVVRTVLLGEPLFIPQKAFLTAKSFVVMPCETPSEQLCLIINLQ